MKLVHRSLVDHRPQVVFEPIELDLIELGSTLKSQEQVLCFHLLALHHSSQVLFP